MTPPPQSKNTEGNLYGLHPVAEALRTMRRTCDCLLLDSKAPPKRFAELEHLAAEKAIPVERCTKHDLFEHCGSRQHQGAVLLASPFPYSPLTDDIYSEPRLLLLDNIEDPRNTGAILRSALLFGFKTVLLPLKGGAGIYPSVVKTSAGATEHLNIVRDANSIRYFQRAKKLAVHTVALDMNGKIPLRNVNYREDGSILLILGGEDKRIGQYILNEADDVAHIPQGDGINSLNASVAAGIAMYHFSPLTS